MNNEELEIRVKEIISNSNMFDMIMQAKEFEKDYKNSDFFKATKMPIVDVIKNAKMFYLVDASNIKDKIQEIIDGIDISSLNKLFDQVSQVYATENNEITSMIKDLADFKDIIKG